MLLLFFVAGSIFYLYSFYAIWKFWLFEDKGETPLLSCQPDITLNYARQHHMKSHPAMPHLITPFEEEEEAPCLIISQQTSSYHTMPQNMTPNLLTSHHMYHTTSHLTTSYKISPHHLLWYHATPQHITSYHITSHEITSYHATSHGLMSHVPHHITSHHATSLDIIPLHTKSHHITSDEDFITSLVITPYLIISKICKPVLSINFTESQKLLMWMGGYSTSLVSCI